MDEALLLARVQFGLNIGFHILFPSITIGLAWYLVWMRIKYERTREAAWLESYRLWVKVFALSFAMGVVSGITMSFQFGTNWPGYMLAVGNVAGPLLAYEVLTAFFLEATFLGVMLFGMNRVSGRVHIAASFIVAAGTTLSAFWILALNSWMQTPTGHMFDAEGELIARDWLAVIFNPSFPLRFTHMLLASGITAAFLVAGLSAWRLLKAPDDAAARASLRFGARIAAVLVPLQIVVGDLHGLNTLEHQPAKIAAMEALWETQRGAPLVLFALVDDETGTNRYAIEVPKLASLILTHDLDGEVAGHRGVRRRPPAGDAGLHRLPRDGGRGGPHAAGFVGRPLRSSKGTSFEKPAMGVRRDDVLGLDRGARRVARHRDRPPALARHRDPAHFRGRGRGERRGARREPDGVRAHVYAAASFLHDRHHSPGAKMRSAMLFDSPP